MDLSSAPAAWRRRALQVFWSWFQGAKRGLPEIPKDFIIQAKQKHAVALQKVLPEIPDEYLWDFQLELKELWRGQRVVKKLTWRDEDGVVRRNTFVIRKPDKKVRPWNGNPGWNASITHPRSAAGKSEAVREWVSVL